MNVLRPVPLNRALRRGYSSFQPCVEWGYLYTLAVSRESKLGSFIFWDFPKSYLKFPSFYYLPQCFPPARGQGKCPFLCAVYQLLILLLFSDNYDSFALQITMIISFLAGLWWVVVGRDCWVEVKLNLASHITSFQSLFIDTVYAPFHHVFIDNFWNIYLLKVKDGFS